MAAAGDKEAGRAPHAWGRLGLGFAVVAFGAVVAALMMALFVRTRPINLLDATDAYAAEVEQTLINAGLAPDHVARTALGRRRDASAEWHAYRFDVRVPSTHSVEGVAKLVDKALRRPGVTRVFARERAAPREMAFAVGGREFATVRLTPAERQETLEAPDSAEASDVAFLTVGVPDYDELALDSAGLDEAALSAPAAVGPPVDDAGWARVAIILDDGGYGGRVTEEVLALNPALTLAILPDTPACTTTAREASALGFEIMLHMPMECFSANTGFPHLLTTTMTADEIRACLDEALEQVPGAVGVNNHAGSKFTADEAAMALVLEELHARGLYFVDSRTTADTKAIEAAGRVDARALSRDVFLDNQADLTYIRNQFDHLVQIAKQQGAAIGICHFRPQTVQTLAEALPTLEASGVALAHVSELMP